MTTMIKTKRKRPPLRNRDSCKASRFRLSRKDYLKLLYEVVFPREKRRCRVCKLRGELHGHHIIYRSHGGGDYSWNLLAVCGDCHQAIHDRHVIVLPVRDGHDINADEGVKILQVNGWKPKHYVRS